MGAKGFDRGPSAQLDVVVNSGQMPKQEPEAVTAILWKRVQFSPPPPAIILPHRLSGGAFSLLCLVGPATLMPLLIFTKEVGFEEFVPFLACPVILAMRSALVSLRFAHLVVILLVV